jgi:hypothetical protein
VDVNLRNLSIKMLNIPRRMKETISLKSKEKNKQMTRTRHKDKDLLCLKME